MHYKMRDQIRFKIGKEEKNIQEKWIEIPEGTEHIQMMIEMPEEFRYMAFLFLEDPKKRNSVSEAAGIWAAEPGNRKKYKGYNDRRCSGRDLSRNMENRNRHFYRICCAEAGRTNRRNCTDSFGPERCGF